VKIVGCGKNSVEKIAFPVRFNPEEEAAMRGEGMYPVTDPEIAETDVMPHMETKGKIRTVVEQLSLPRILFPKRENIIELDGRQYYLVDVRKPQKRANPQGTIYLMDIETGLPVKKEYTANADRMEAIKTERLQTSIADINQKIKKWNERVTNVGAVANPSTWPLQLVWAEEVIGNRLNEVNSMMETFKRKVEETPETSAAYESAITRLRSDLKSGRITGADLVDTAMFIFDNDQDAFRVVRDDASNVVSLTLDGAELNASEAEKKSIAELMKLRSEGDIESTRRRVEKEEAKRRRMEGELPAYGTPTMEPLQEVTVEQAKGGYPSAEAYFGRGSYASQPRAILAGLQDTKKSLEDIISTFKGLRSYVAGLAEGERAKALLTSTERGAEIKRDINDFQEKATKFLKRYAENLFVQEQEGQPFKINKNLFSSKGMGNAEVAVVVNQLLSIIKNSLTAHEGAAQAAVPPAEASRWQYSREDAAGMAP